ncbi:hypothetical protein OHQ89_16145 [Streptomyces canus]|uniref:hypothetical protein n=1 Tax=Streptomyces canus TaxID=58343 RepID=UPI0030DDF1D7
MQLSDKAIAEFKELYRKELGKEIDDDTAYSEATALLELVKVLSEPIDSDRDVAYLEELRRTRPRRK